MESGPYSGLDNVELWGRERDARAYAGPWPVVAHPPCARWGRYWSGGPNAAGKFRMGDDGGCFKAALDAVRQFGGVLEHPADSRAWLVFGINRPNQSGWIRAGIDDPGWTCRVEQGHYGHKARKATWLYLVGNPIELIWGPSNGSGKLEESFRTKEQAAAARSHPDFRPTKRLTTHEREATPIRFRDLLIGLAERSDPWTATVTGSTD